MSTLRFISPAAIYDLALRAYREVGFKTTRHPDGRVEVMDVPTETQALMDTFQAMLCDAVDPPILGPRLTTGFPPPLSSAYLANILRDHAEAKTVNGVGVRAYELQLLELLETHGDALVSLLLNAEARGGEVREDKSARQLVRLFVDAVDGLLMYEDKAIADFAERRDPQPNVQTGPRKWLSRLRKARAMVPKSTLRPWESAPKLGDGEGDVATDLATKLTNAIIRYVASLSPDSQYSPSNEVASLHGTLQEVFLKLGAPSGVGAK